jgi:hypothetical protein
MGLRPGPDRPNEGGFLGHPQEETFWEDAFDLVHKDDLPLLWFLVSMVMEEPGASESVEELVDHRGQPIGAVDVGCATVGLKIAPYNLPPFREQR